MRSGPVTKDILDGVEQRITDRAMACADAQAEHNQTLAKIKAYAPHIVNERHLNSILDDIEDRAMRREVRKFLIPFLKFRVQDVDGDDD